MAKRVERDQIKTSPAKIFKSGNTRSIKCSRLKQAGFTLMEIMIVITIIAAIMGIGAPILFNQKNKMKNGVQKIAVLAREIHNLSRLENRTYRLVLSMNENKQHSYWVESATGQIALLNADQAKELASMTELDREKKEGESPFKIEPKVTKEAVKLPKGLSFESVEYGGKSTAISSGVAYVHFLPQGLAEDAVIHITDKKTLNWTITIHPLTGRAMIYDKKISLKELRDQ